MKYVVFFCASRRQRHTIKINQIAKADYINYTQYIATRLPTYTVLESCAPQAFTHETQSTIISRLSYESCSIIYLMYKYI